MLRSTGMALCLVCVGPAMAQDFNEYPPNAAGQAPAFEGQTRAPLLTDEIALETTTVVEGLEHPWGMAELPDGSWLVTERPGRLRMVSPEGALSAPITGLPEIDPRGQGGLLDVVVNDDFPETRRVWWSFAEPRAKWKSLIRGRNYAASRTAVATGTLSEDGTAIENAEVIFRQDPAWHGNSHFGSRLVFDPEGALFVTTGDRSDPEASPLAQDPGTHIGKVLRLAPEGGPAAGNPEIEGGQPKVWSLGHRNLQAAALAPDGHLWTVEHGPQGGDELNRPEPGGNYGWPVISYGQDYSGAPVGEGQTEAEAMEQPVYYWDPVIAPSGMAFYTGEMFPEWSGDALIGGLAGMALVRLRLADGKVIGEARHLQDIGRVRDVEVASDGAIMLLIDDPEAPMIRVTRGNGDAS
ncbi:PQQ-dependent sugar dehydrogenase [Paracoccus zhejiangensis]|uniref:Glucose dehydrogenase n=1 Tax=Paracoccus zhejiangensis TaxID=1077935 RepID=A0A2H5F060_9RHOB|nr:PQQ-dependent sugar dehydrogenase [Paracoccus zhejiangensis]AUH64939.1 glucose dehydrogenase [Paracoccus zhejiangensis]